jgi:hypothetical protein
MNRLESISASPTLKSFAQGAAQDAIQPIADFLAPTVPVSAMNGRYKVYTEKNRFHIPDTLRAIGGRATELRFEATDAYYNCEPHALDYPVDNLESLEAQGLEDVLREGAVSVAEIAALAHEKKTIDAALTAAGAGTGLVWNSSADPINDLDTYIKAVILAAKYGSAMGVGVLFGVGAWQIFKNQAEVRKRFIASGASKGLAVPSESIATQLLLASPEIRTSFMVYDSAAEGLSASMAFLLDTSILVFARKSSPTRRDPSFMKTFRLMNKWMVPGSYVREVGRAEVAKFDWSEDVRVTNSTAVQRLVITTA